MNRLLPTILVYGVAGALVVGALMVFGMMSWTDGQPPENGVVVGYLTQLVALTVVFLGIKHHRDRALGGVIKFLPAFGVGVAISAVASLGWVFSWEIVLASGFDYSEAMKQMTLAQIEQERAKGVAEAVLQKKIADAQTFLDLYMNNPLVRMPISFIEMFPAGILVSLISAGLLRNSRFMPERQAA